MKVNLWLTWIKIIMWPRGTCLVVFGTCVAFLKGLSDVDVDVYFRYFYGRKMDMWCNA
jgi:hypothetical protein